MSLATTGNIPNFGCVDLLGVRRVSSKRSELSFRAKFEGAGDLTTLYAAFDENTTVCNVAVPNGSRQNLTIRITIDTTGASKRFAKQQGEDLLVAMKRKVQPDAVTVPDRNPVYTNKAPATRRH